MRSSPSVNEASPEGAAGSSVPMDQTVTAALPSEEPAPPTRGPAVGSTVSRYVVLDELGRGGMGRVLRAYDPKLEREVALKELHRTALDEDAAKRLVLEARAMAKLSHPHVVAVYDVEELDARRVVLVMELVRGTTLRRWLAATERSWPQVMAMLVQAGRGLAAAHGAGLLHRDFKPGNVLVGEDGTAKVTDFGLAKMAVDDPLSLSSSSLVVASGSLVDVVGGLTAAGTVMGTPRYMAPEQHRGEKLTAAADQYAFCVTLWEALCGAPPFARGTMDEMAARKLEPLPPWPKAGVPRPIVEAIVRGLSAKPEDRWPSMDALLEALAWDGSRRRTRALLGLGAIVVASAAVVSYQAWAERRAQRCSGAQQQLAGIWDDETRAQVQRAFAAVEVPYAEQAWRRTDAALAGYAQDWAAMHTEACEATTVRGEQSPQQMDLRMACLHRAAVELRSTVDVLVDADAEVVQKAHELTGDLRSLARCADPEALAAEVEPPEPTEAAAVEEARARLAAARTRINVGRYLEAKAAVEQARTLLEGVEYGPVRTEVALVEGDVLERLGDYAASEAALEEALRRAGRWRQWSSMQQAATRLLVVVGDRQKRMEDGLRYRALAEGLSESHPEDEAEFRNNLGNVLHAQGRYAEAEAEHRAVLASWEARLGPDHPAVAASRNNLATALSAQGKHAEAEAEHRAALAARAATLGPDHPDVAASRNNLVTALYAQGKLGDAEAEIRAALAAREATLGPDHPDVAASRTNLANVLYAQGKHEAAEVEYRAALMAMEASLGPDHANVAMLRSNLANVLDTQGKHGAAEVEYRAALAALEASLGSEHPAVAMLRNNLGNALEAEGKHAEAEAEHRTALASRLASLGPDHPDVAQSHHNLAKVLLALERPGEAVPLAEQAWTRHQRDDVPPEHRAATALLLARSQWQVATGAKDRERARSLAEDALQTYRTAGDAYRDDADDVRAWLAAHPGD